MEKDSGESTADRPEITKRVFTNLETFLQAILARFLENVDPIESGLMDNLRQDNVLGCDEEEEVRAEATRINKARKCWELLQAVQPAVFQRHCFPALEKFCPHVLQEAEFCWDERAQAAAELCLQHVIKKTCLRQFADLFKMTGACTHEEYCTVTEGSPNSAKWDLVFRLCQKHGENTEFVKQVKSKLISIQVEIPDNFHTLLSTGFPCVCKTEASTRHKEKKIGKSKKTNGLKRKQEKSLQNDVFSISATKRKKLEHDSKSEACESSSVYPPSTADDSRDKDKGSASISTTETTVAAEVSDHEIEETQFETEEQKETFLLEMEQINKAVTKACSIRALYRELVDIKEELSTFGIKAKSESETTTNRAFLNDEKMYRLQDRARNIYQTLKQSYEEVKKIAAEEFKFDDELPFTCKKVLLERRYIFVSEVTEATPFFQQAEMLFPTKSHVPVLWIFDDDDSRDAIQVEDERSSDSEDNDNYSEDHISDLSSDDTNDDNSGEGSENDDTNNLYGDDQLSDLLPGDNDLDDDDFDDGNDYCDDEDEDDDDDDDTDEDDDNHEYDDPDNDDIDDDTDEDY